jgi:tetratricopeptide (TPR) repeat protein
LIDYYVHAADAAFRVSSAYPDLMPLRETPLGIVPETFVDYKQALKWLVVEYSNIIDVFNLTVAHGFHVQTMQLARALYNFQEEQGHWHDLGTTQRAALTAAGYTDDPAGWAHARIGSARVAALRGQYDQAHGHYDEATRLFEELGEDAALAYAESHRAKIFDSQGDYRGALQHVMRALEFCRSAGRQRGEAEMLNGMGWCHTNIGDHAQAVACCNQALVIYGELDSQLDKASGPGQAATYGTLAHALCGLGDYVGAIKNYHRAIDICHKLGIRVMESFGLIELSDAYQAVDESKKAREALEQALAIVTEYSLPGAGRIRVKLLGLGSARVYGATG